MEDNNERLQAFCSVTFDDAFVVRDLKIIEGTKGSFVAMPSRKLTDRCGSCGCKNHLRARYCNQCGHKLDEDPGTPDAAGRAKPHADIAHPINSACREGNQGAAPRASHHEDERAKMPGYVCSYDDYDAGDYDESFTQLIGELNAPARATGDGYRAHAAHNGPRGTHANGHDAKAPVSARDDAHSQGFGEGIL